MASKPQPPPDSDPNRAALPFEPKRRNSSGKKPEKQAAMTAHPSQSSKSAAARTSQEIPETVSKRMIRRMAVFCGVPTALGISSFFVSYLAVTHGVELPNTVVLLVSLGLFGLGVVGLSYSVLSASWEEDTPGSLLGVSEFRTNFGRMVSAWGAAKRDPQSK